MLGLFCYLCIFQNIIQAELVEMFGVSRTQLRRDLKQLFEEHPGLGGQIAQFRERDLPPKICFGGYDAIGMAIVHIEMDAKSSLA